MSMGTSNPDVTYNGQFQHAFSQNRVQIPSKWRSEKPLVMLPTGKCLLLLPPPRIHLVEIEIPPQCIDGHSAISSHLSGTLSGQKAHSAYPDFLAQGIHPKV